MTTTLTSPSTSPMSGPVALAGAPRPAGAPKPKPRKRVNTAEKRHQHNAIERQRRETLNGKFLVLARLLPSLAACRRPSKSAIVNGSISHLGHQRQQRLLASKLLRQLAQERDQLFAEVNQWRQANGCQAKPGTPTVWSDEMEEVCQVEKETFGSFANYDDGNDDQNDDDEAADVSPAAMNLEKANMVAGNLSSGLITPRSSADFSNGPNTDGMGFVDTHSSAGADWGTHSFSMPPSVPFNAFMNDNTDASPSSGASPAGSSHQSTSLLTPPNVDRATYFHTPSPHSSAGGSGSADDQATPASSSQTWTPQQLAFFQQQVQQQHLQRAQQQQQASFAALAQGGASAESLGLFMQQQAQQQSQQQQQQQPQQAHFAQLMATMFPQQRDMSSADAPADWRKLALGDLLGQDKGAGGNLFFGGGGWNEQAAVGVQVFSCNALVDTLLQ